jgi:uncharacterized protein (DUF1778 family)
MAARNGKARPNKLADHRIMVRLSREQYENLAHAAEASVLPIAVFARSVLVQASKDFRLRGITSKRSPAGTEAA